MGGCILAGIILFSPACAADPSARDVMQQVERNQRVSAESIHFEMVLIDKSGFERRRRVREYRERESSGLEASLIFFDDPPDIRGSALLSKERADDRQDGGSAAGARDGAGAAGRDDQWLYLPAVGKIRRIADSGRTDYFLGTDLTFEDFSVEDIDRFVYRFFSSDTIIAGRPARVIDAVATDTESQRRSGYGVRRVTVDAERFVILRTEYYDRVGQLIKTMEASAVKPYGSSWRADVLHVDNLKRRHKTRIVISGRALAASFPPDLFTPRTLQRGALPEIAPHPTKTTLETR